MMPIALQPDVSQIEWIRLQFERQRCVVVGSAPLPTKLAEIEPGERVIAVNGGISSLPGHADVWVLNSKQQDRPNDPKLRPMHAAMLRQGKGRSAGHLLLLRGPKVASEAYTLGALDRLGARYNSWSVLDKTTKRWFEGEQCGRVRDDKPCSAGILTVAMALWCGSSHVRMVGFSLKPGYNYIKNSNPPPSWRDHVEADRRAIRILSERYGSRLSGSLIEAVAA